jgi:hypothetical protein
VRSDPLLASALYQQTLSMVVHADAKAGKTTLSGTSPKPLLLLDAEGGTKFLPFSRTFWDPRTGPPPMPDGTWEVCTVIVRDYETLGLVYQWLITGQHGFASISIDSVTEVQRRCKENLVGTEQMKTQDWGRLLDQMLHLIRAYRDLTVHPTNPVSTVVFIAETKMTNDKWRPYMQGQMASSLPYTVDILGYLYVAQVPDPVDPLLVHQQRQLLVSPHPQFEAGERVQGRLGAVVAEPNVSTMLATVYNPLYVPDQGVTT